MHEEDSLDLSLRRVRQQRSADEVVDMFGAEPERLVVLEDGFELGEHILDADRILLLPSSVRNLPAGQGERALCGAGKVLLFALEVRLTTFRSLAETLTYTSPDLIGNYMRLNVLAKILHVRGHAPPNLEHLLLYALRRLAHYLILPHLP